MQNFQLVCVTMLFIFCFSANAQNLKQIQQIYPPDIQAESRFGGSVSMDGAFMLIGAHVNETDAAYQNVVSQAGAAYLYELNQSNNWVFHQKLVALDRQSDDFFGYQVDIQNDYAVCGAHGHKLDVSGMNSLTYAGAVYIFKKGGLNNWSQTQKIVAHDRDDQDWFGWAVKMDGDFLAIGAVADEHDSLGIDSGFIVGSVYIYKRDVSGQYNFLQKISASDRRPESQFGSFIDLENGLLVIGSDYHAFDENGQNKKNEAGAVYVFRYDPSSDRFIQKQKLVASDRSTGDYFGFRVNINDQDILVSAVYADYYDTMSATNIIQAGKVYYFKHNIGDVWNETFRLSDGGLHRLDQFGVGIDSYNDLLVVAAPQYTIPSLVSSGRLYLYSKDQNGNWLKLQEFVPDQISDNDETGFDIAMDNQFVMVGAHWKEYADTIEKVGCVYVTRLCEQNLTSVDTCLEPGQQVFAGGSFQSVAGTYYDTLTAYLGCDSVVETTITTMTNCGTSLKSIDLRGINVYPNPFTTEVTLSGLIQAKVQKIEVLDMLGNVLFVLDSKNATNESVNLDLSELSEGSYVLFVYADSYRHALKILKY